MFMCVVNLKSVNKLDLTWKQSFLIEVATHRFFIEKYLCSTNHRMGGNSSNTLIVVPFIESTIKCSRIHEESETLSRFLLALLEAEI